MNRPAARIGYARVATADQNLDAQLAVLEAARCTMVRTVVCHVVHAFEIGLSGRRKLCLCTVAFTLQVGQCFSHPFEGCVR